MECPWHQDQIGLGDAQESSQAKNRQPASLIKITLILFGISSQAPKIHENSKSDRQWLDNPVQMTKCWSGESEIRIASRRTRLPMPHLRALLYCGQDKNIPFYMKNIPFGDDEGCKKEGGYGDFLQHAKIPELPPVLLFLAECRVTERYP